MNREIGRAETDTDREHAGDHVINALWSAWHLHEWVWDAIRDNAPSKARVLLQAGLPSNGITNQKQFGAELARRHKDLEIARIIATSVKHVHVMLEPDSPRAVRTHFSSTAHTTIYMKSGDPNSTVRKKIHWVPKIVVDGKSVSARALLTRIDAFWVAIIY
jgi:hypothetical protein